MVPTVKACCNTNSALILLVSRVIDVSRNLHGGACSPRRARPSPRGALPADDVAGLSSRPQTSSDVGNAAHTSLLRRLYISCTTRRSAPSHAEHATLCSMCLSTSPRRLETGQSQCMHYHLATRTMTVEGNTVFVPGGPRGGHLRVRAWDVFKRGVQRASGHYFPPLLALIVLLTNV